MKIFLITFFSLLTITSCITPALAIIEFNYQAEFSDDANTTAIAAYVEEEVTEVNTDKHDGSTLDKAIDAYFPVSVAETSTISLTYQWHTSLPLISADLPLNPKFALTFFHSEEGEFSLHMAVENSSHVYKVISTVSDVEPQEKVKLEATYKGLCYTGDRCELNTYDSGAIQENEVVFVFMAVDGAYKNDDTIDITKVAEGQSFYVNLMFSSEYDSTHAPEVEKINRGDKNLALKYNFGGVDNSIKNTLYKMVLFRHEDQSSGAAQAGATFKTVKSAIDDETRITLHDINGPLVIPIYDLINGESYTYSVAMMNRFYFISKNSNAMSQVPLELESFLKTQGCFLLSAGLQQNHFLLTFFRNFRDQTLQHSYLGRSFINFYYSWAYDYALIVANSPFLRVVVVAFAFVLYALILFIKTGFLPLMLLGTFVFFKASFRPK